MNGKRCSDRLARFDGGRRSRRARGFRRHAARASHRIAAAHRRRTRRRAWSSSAASRPAASGRTTRHGHRGRRRRDAPCRRPDPHPRPDPGRARGRRQPRSGRRLGRALHLPARHQRRGAPGHALLARLRAAGQRRRHRAVRPGAGRRSGCHRLTGPRRAAPALRRRRRQRHERAGAVRGAARRPRQRQRPRLRPGAAPGPARTARARGRRHRPAGRLVPGARRTGRATAWSSRPPSRTRCPTSRPRAPPACPILHRSELLAQPRGLAPQRGRQRHQRQVDGHRHDLRDPARLRAAAGPADRRRAGRPGGARRGRQRARRPEPAPDGGRPGWWSRPTRATAAWCATSRGWASC